MKDKILVFVIGLLVGAILTASAFLILDKTTTNDQMPMGDRMQMMERPDGETPPEKPEDRQNDGERPEMPSKNNGSTNDEIN